MKHDWEYKKIKDITSLFTDGDWIESKDQSESGIRLIQTGNIGDGFYIGKEDRPHFISEETFERLKCTEIFEGDCLISRLPQPLGRSCLLPKLDCRAITAVDCSILRFKNICNPYYFVYYTQSFKYQNTVDINATGTTRKRISRKNLENIPIPLPPLSTQQSIVSELDSLSKIIADCKETLKDYDALEQSIFYDMFGDPVKNEKKWEVKKLGDICIKITDGTHDTPERLTEGVKFITGKHIRPGVIDYDNSDYVDEDTHKEIYSRCNPEYGDVLYTNIGANLANAAVNTVSYEFSMKNVALFKPQKNILDGVYLQFFLNDYKIKDRIIENYANGGAQSFLSLKALKTLPIVLPHLTLQQQFASKIEAIEQMKSETKEALQEAETLFQARMDYWFG